MRRLREFFTSSRPPSDPRPIEPVAVLAVAVRAEPAFDPEVDGDRALFGLSADELAALGPRVPHLLELAYEVIEGSGVRFSRIASLGLAVVHAGPDPLDPAALLDVFGLRAESTSIRGGLLDAIHVAARACRCGDTDLVLVLAEDPPGASAVLLARAERAGREEWRARCLLTGTASGPDLETARAHASARAATTVDEEPEDAGVAGFARAVTEIQSGAFGVRRVVDGAAAVVLAAPEPVTVGEIDPRFLGISARSGRSLVTMAQQAVDRLTSDVELQRLAAEAVRKPAFEHRLAVPVGAVRDSRDRLTEWLTRTSTRASIGHVEDPPPVVFVLPPTGALFAKATDRLYGAEPAFRDALNRCDRIARPHLHRSILSVLFPSPGREDELGDPAFDHALTFAVGWSLAELLRAFKVEPAHVIGCGVGEIAAAAIAGSISLDDGIRLACERGKLVREVPEAGIRAVFGLSEEQVSTLFGGLEEVDVVALPRPGRVVIGGTAEAVRTVLDRADQRGIRYAEMDGNPVHGPLVDPIVPAFREVAAELVFTPTDVAIWSTATGRRVRYASAEHWVATLRAPLRLTDAVTAAASGGGRVFVELGARPTIGAAGEQALHDSGCRWLPTLSPDTDDALHFRELLASLWALGVPASPGNVAGGWGGAPAHAYPFDRRALSEEWIDDRSEGPSGPPTLDGSSPRWREALADDPGDETPVPADERELLDLAAAATAAANATPAPVPARAVFAPDDEAAREPADHHLGELTVDEVVAFRPPPLLEDESTSHAAMDLLAPSAITGHSGPIWTEEWNEAPTTESDKVGPTTWVILCDRGGIGSALADTLEKGGHHVVRVEHGAEARRDRPTLFVADPIADDAWMDTLEGIGSLQGGAVHVAHLWSLDADAPAAAGWPAATSLCQEMLNEGLPAVVHVVTRGAVRDPSGAVEKSAALWGLTGLLSAETGMFGGVIDLDPEVGRPAYEADLLAYHLTHVPALPEAGGRVALREGMQLVQKLVGAREPRELGTLDPAATWLLGGSVDATTLEIADALVARGARRIMVIAAAAPPPELVKAALEFQKHGTTFQVVRANPAEPKGLEQIRQRLGREKLVAGLVLYQAPTPRSLREVGAREDLERWSSAVDGAAALLGLLPDGAKAIAWCCGRALDGTAGNGVGAFVASSLGGLFLARRQAGQHAGIVHSGQHAELPPGETLRLALALGAAGGTWGLWPA